MTTIDFETAIAGIYIAIISALGQEARSTANEMLLSLADDTRMPRYVAKLFNDLAESVEMVAPSWLAFEELETLH